MEKIEIQVSLNKKLKQEKERKCKNNKNKVHEVENESKKNKEFTEEYSGLFKLNFKIFFNTKFFFLFFGQ